MNNEEMKTNHDNSNQKEVLEDIEDNIELTVQSFEDKEDQLEPVN